MQQIYECDAAADLTGGSISLWQDSGTSFPLLGRRYTKAEQREREAFFDEYLDEIQAESFQLPQNTSERATAHQRITSAFAQIAACAMDLHDPYVELLLRNGFSSLSSDFARCARNFDAELSVTDILQACRNAWVACGMQLLLGKTMRLTPAIFGYSMLYPYSDNYLDEAGISRENKLEFSARFRMRLAGDTMRPTNALEALIWRCVETIESQYARTEYPRVYDSLLAIHQAQQQSIRQLHRNAASVWRLADEIDIVTLTFAKGGASVLADAYLAAGSLNEVEARFSFEWGIVLQLGDDLQDLHQDRQRGSLTLFTEAAGREPLDSLTNRTFHFAQKVMTRMDALPHATAILNELLRRSSQSLLIRSAANAGEFYTQEYLAELETYSPVRFSFLKNREERLSRRYAWFATLFEALVMGEDGTPELVDESSSING